MKTKLYLFLLFVSALSFGQTTIAFDYDAAGNQTRRYIVVRRPPITPPLQTAKEAIVDKASLIKDDLYQGISYYPNPVRDDLYVTWTSQDGNNVENIQVYDLSGKLIRQYSNLATVDNANISFQSYPDGYYNVILDYKNGETKVLKIIRK
jgi:hypothetical protein